MVRNYVEMGENMKLVSVVVPVYNVERYLRKCIESILAQTYEKFELILVNDGSKDNSGKICDEYAKIDKRIKVIHQKNGGLSNARNSGIRVSKGDYIYFVDSDDYLETESLEQHIKYCEKYDLDISLADVNITTESGMKTKCSTYSSYERIMTGEDYLAERIIQQSYFIMVYMGMYRSSLIKNNDLYFMDGIVHEDEEWSPRVLIAAKKVMFIPGCYYDYVQHSQSITKSKQKIKNLESTFIICDELERFFLSVPLKDNNNRKYYLDILARLYMSMSCCGVLPEGTYKRFDKTFPNKYAYMKKTKKQVLLYTFSIRLYRYLRKFVDWVNHLGK